MENKVIFKVVRIGGLLVFNFNGVYFDNLNAYPFEGGKLIACNNGELVDETSWIKEYGTHGACTCFCGLRKVRMHATAALYPSLFAEGDVICITFESEKNFDFRQFLIDIRR